MTIYDLLITIYGPYPVSDPMREISGINIAITIKPTIIAITTIKMGSIRLVKADTAVSTSSS